MTHTTFFEAWHFLDDHYIFQDKHKLSRFKDCLDIVVVQVNPETEAIDDDETKNTATAIWVEMGPYANEFPNNHDTDLDCGAFTFEEAIIELAGLVEKKYGTNEEPKITREELDAQWAWE